MKHLINFESLNEAKRSLSKKSYKLMKMRFKYRLYDIENDKFLREIWCKEHAPQFLTEGKKYRLYAEFESGAMLSGKCFIVFCDNNEFIGFDSGYFLEEYEYDAKKYNI
jgi:hypothetical protein